jgi:biotin carboxyl carrier protein
MRYAVTVGGRTFDVEIVGGEVRVDGRHVRASLRTVPGTPERRLTLDEIARTFAMTRAAEGWELVCRGEVLEARVVDERTQALGALTARRGSAGGTHAVRAPMPGLVVRVEVAVGTVVSPGQGLVVLEAMKMENELSASTAGTVTAVHAVPGQPVEKGTVLVEVSEQG